MLFMYRYIHSYNLNGTLPVRQTLFCQTPFRPKMFCQNLKSDLLSNDVLSNDILSKKFFVNIPVRQMTFCQMTFVKFWLGPKPGFHLYNSGPDSPLQALGDERKEF
jgi:hypothetical protein